MTTEFNPRNKLLWQTVLSESVRHYKNQPHDAWEVRERAVKIYCRYAGDFHNKKLQPTTGKSGDYQATIINILTQGGEVNASLMARSLDHQWRQYFGHNIISLEDFSSEASSAMPLIIRPRSYFGVRYTTLGYEIMLPDAKNTRIVLPNRIGYTLLSLSREISVRESRYRDAIPEDA